MLSILKKLTLQKKLQTSVTNNVFVDKKVKHNNKTKTHSIKILAGAEISTRDPLHPKRMRYLWTTESTESYECSQAI